MSVAVAKEGSVQSDELILGDKEGIRTFQSRGSKHARQSHADKPGHEVTIPIPLTDGVNRLTSDEISHSVTHFSSDVTHNFLVTAHTHRREAESHRLKEEKI